MKTKRGWVGVVAVAIILAACIIGGCSLYGQYLEETEVTLTVKDKERIVDRDGSGSRYLIWTGREFSKLFFFLCKYVNYQSWSFVGDGRTHFDG